MRLDLGCFNMKNIHKLNFFQKCWLVLQDLIEKNIIQKDVYQTYRICFNSWYGDVLDVGCGDGKRQLNQLVKALQSGKIKTYTGIDLDPKLIERFEEKKNELPHNINKKIKLKVCDICNFHHNKKFDYIVATAVYDHLKYPKKFLKVTKKLLKRNGIMFVNEFNEKMDFTGKFYIKFKMFVIKILRIPKKFELAPHIRFSFLPQVIKMFKQFGFKIKEAKEVKRGWYIILTV